MSENKLKKMNIILTIIVALCIVTIITMLNLWPKQTKNNSLTDSNETTKNNVETTAQEDKADIIEIKTPYCTLKYPSAWSKNLKYEENKEEDVYSQTFYCNIKEKEIEMFTIYFGDSEAGTHLGYIIKDGEKIAFSVDVNTYETDDTWTKKEKKLLNSMTEGVNDVIISVTSNENFYEE